MLQQFAVSGKGDAAMSWGTSGGLATLAAIMPGGWPQFVLWMIAAFIGIFRGLYEYEKWKLIRKQKKLPSDG